MKGIFHAIKNYYIAIGSDSIDLVIDQGNVNKDGKKVYKPIGFYSTLPGVIDGLTKQLIRDKVHAKKEVGQLEELKAIALETQKEVRDICKKLTIDF